jgi:predicted RNA-binding protein YlqC (UPF0109 family)
MSVDVAEKYGSTAVTATPQPKWAGNLIGKQGRCISSLRLLAAMVGDKHGYKISLTVDTPEESAAPAPRSVLTPRCQWDAIEVKRLMQDVLDAALEHPAEVELSETKNTAAFEVVLAAEERECGRTLTVSGEALRGDDALGAAVGTVFGAIGKMRGKACTVTLVRRKQPKQPTSAAGRYAQEIKT